jgi:hypothetical protein
MGYMDGRQVGDYNHTIHMKLSKERDDNSISIDIFYLLAS